jgi:dipeptidyl aminopeptidase/acylaminoacyl peptidase
MAILAAAVAAMVGSTPLTATGTAQHHQDEGQIVWTHRAAPGSEQIVVARADGSWLRPLTPALPDTFDLDATISPDGRWVLYGRETPGSVGTRLITIDGTRDRSIQLGCSDPCASTAAATWLTNQRIAFTKVIGPFEGPNGSARSAVLYTSKPDGSNVRRLSQLGIDGSYEDGFARLTQDGRYLTFMRGRNDPPASALFRMRPDGTDVRQLTPWDLKAENYDLSPAGLIVFQTFGKGDPTGTGRDLATVPANCGSLAACTRQIRYLTDNGTSGRRSSNPSWSPDGSHIAFAARPSIEVENADIWTMRYDGTALHQVSTSPEFDYRPDWGRH